MSGWCWPYFSKTIIARRFGPAQPRGVAWNGAGGWEIFSQWRQVNFSRTVWITFQRREITSSVSVTSSPIFDSFSEPQQAQDVGGGTTTRSRGRCAGNGLRTGLRRVNSLTWVVPAAARSAASSSSVALASSSSSCSSSWSSSRCLRSERQPYISRLSFSIVSFRKTISAAASDTFASAFAARASAAARAVFRATMLDPPVIGGIESHRPIRRYANRRVSHFATDQPARDGRQVRTGLRQSIPSSR